MEKECQHCAYSEVREGKTHWCKFHERNVSAQNSCKDFLDSLDSPLISELINDVKNESEGKSINKKVPFGVYVRDFFSWIAILIFILLGILIFLYF